MGIDPGLTGAIALIRAAGRPGAELSLYVEDMPLAQVDKGGRKGARQIMEHALAAIVRDMAPDVAYVERVHSMPAQGVVSTFTFGDSYGLVRGVLAGHGIRFEVIDPQRWGALVHLGKGEGASRARASQLFPAEARQFIPKGSHGRADAALIALAGLRLSPF